MNMQKVAQVCGCSKSLVSLALRGDGRVAETTAQRIRGVAQKLGYSVDAATRRWMREMRGGGVRGETVALIASGRATDLEQGLRSRLQEDGGRFDLLSAALSKPRLKSILTARGIRGAVVLKDAPLASWLHSQGFYVALVLEAPTQKWGRLAGTVILDQIARHKLEAVEI